MEDAPFTARKFNSETWAIGSMEDAPFTARKFSKDTWVIEGTGSYSYLVLGDERAVMVDTGMSKLNLREFVKTITGLPVSVINTHGHFDHTGGNGWFDATYMHPYASREARTVFDFGGGTDYPLAYPIETVTEGHVFDLGGRTLEVIEIPGHSPGSIALLDEKSKLLFTGDELEAGQVLLMFGSGEYMPTVEGHQRNMTKLEERINEFDYICPGHNGTPMHNSYVDAFIENAQKVLDGVEGKADIYSTSLPAAFVAAICPSTEYLRRSEHKGSSIVYDLRSIRDK